MSNSPQSTHDAADPPSPAGTAKYETESESDAGAPDEEAQRFDESQRSSPELDLDTVLWSLLRRDENALIDAFKNMMSQLSDLASTVQRMRELYMANQRNSNNHLTQLEFAETSCRIIDSLTDQMFARAKSESNAAGGSIDSTDSTDSTSGERSVDDGVNSSNGAKKRSVDDAANNSDAANKRRRD